ncbi:MAG: hypothetical protein KAG72_03655 [Abyssibacter sp.]|uniref:hypothetical protein n=1 Tax=Abyssibacter sp. TaxID=2320200 RepID=UPI0025B8B4EB|nr:hypothetical protein [Abyssibacter sp.]MCK5858421.1 hypothetical protein [Abyssibacter sp.]
MLGIQRFPLPQGEVRNKAQTLTILWESGNTEKPEYFGSQAKESPTLGPGFLAALMANAILWLGDQDSNLD